jgi:transposase
MPKTVELTPKKRSAIVALRNEGLTYREIGAKLHVSKSSVERAVKLVSETGQYNHRQRSGRPRTTTKHDDMMIKRLCQKNPFISSVDIKAELPYMKFSPRTIRRRLQVDCKLLSRRAARKPLLTEAQRKKRLAFCKKYKDWTVKDWQKVTFSDESTFSQFGTHLHRVRRPTNARYEERYTIGTMKHPQKVMVWGCFSAKGRGSLYFLSQNETITAKKYLSILDPRLKDSMHIQRTKIFQHDGAPAHTAKVVKSWLQKSKIQVLDWPGNSPDLNPIENLWELMKRRLARKCPKNMQDVHYWLKRVWCEEMSGSNYLEDVQ